MSCVNSSGYTDVDIDGSQVALDRAVLLADGSDSGTVQVQVRRRDGGPIQGLHVWLQADYCEVVQPTQPTDVSGKTSGSIRSQRPGTCTVDVQIAISSADFRVALKSKLGATFVASAQDAVVGTYQPAVRLVVEGGTSSYAGDALSYGIRAVDATGQTALTFVGAVHFSSTDPTASMPPDLVFGPTDSGLKVATGGVVFRRSGIQTLVVSDLANQLPKTQVAITVSPAAAKGIVLQPLPATAVAGSPLTLVVRAVDAYQNLATNYLGTVVFSVSDAQATVPPPFAFAASDGGTRSFPGALRFRTAGLQPITVQDGSLGTPGSSSQSVQVTADAATRLLITDLPVALSLSTPATVTVTARDAYGNRVAN